MVLLWIAVGCVLYYDHGVEAGNPALTAAQRQSNEQGLYAISAVFLLFNAVMTVLRLRMAMKTEQPDALRQGKFR